MSLGINHGSTVDDGQNSVFLMLLLRFPIPLRPIDTGDDCILGRVDPSVGVGGVANEYILFFLDSSPCKYGNDRFNRCTYDTTDTNDFLL